MNYERTSLWIQVGTALAVIAGLLLVVWELQQVRTLARAQLTSDFMAMSNAVYSTVIGESAASVIAKACLDPESLTPSEVVIMNDYYLAHVTLLARMVSLTDRDGIYATGYWQELIAYLNPVVKSAYGRSWFNGRISVSDGWQESLVEEGRNYIEQLGPPNCVSDFDL
jgi:hypothetical protein